MQFTLHFEFRTPLGTSILLDIHLPIYIRPSDTS